VQLHRLGGQASPGWGPPGPVWMMIGTSKDLLVPIGSDRRIAASHRRSSSGGSDGPLTGQLQVWG